MYFPLMRMWKPVKAYPFCLYVKGLKKDMCTETTSKHKKDHHPFLFLFVLNFTFASKEGFASQSHSVLDVSEYI